MKHIGVLACIAAILVPLAAGCRRAHSADRGGGRAGQGVEAQPKAGQPRPGAKVTLEPGAELLDVPFSVLDGGVLALAPRRGHPVEAFERLSLVLPNGKMARVDRLSRLRGWVEIDTPEQALAFCRLKTSPATYFPWDDDNGKCELEIVAKEQVTTAFCFGDERWTQALRGSRYSGHYGVLASKADFARLGIEPAEARATSDGYEVRRALLAEDLKTDELRMAKVVESVGHDGSYARKKEDVTDTPQGVWWFIPKFE